MCGGDVVSAGVSQIFRNAGLFLNWKMSGYHYNDYADIRVGSPITT